MQDYGIEAVARQASTKLMRLQGAYQRLFGASPVERPSVDDAALVVEDLKRFCHVHDDMAREQAHLMAYEVGKFRVWQRIDGMRFPRAPAPAGEQPLQVSTMGDDDGDERRRSPAGRGIVQPTDD